MLCYVIYVSLDWRNLSTSLTTCVLTALTTIGSSRQKQVLRIAGFILGGVIAGLGATIFILPSIDSIVGFTVLFAIMTLSLHGLPLPVPGSPTPACSLPSRSI